MVKTIHWLKKLGYTDREIMLSGYHGTSLACFPGSQICIMTCSFLLGNISVFYSVIQRGPQIPLLLVYSWIHFQRILASMITCMVIFPVIYCYLTNGSIGKEWNTNILLCSEILWVRYAQRTQQGQLICSVMYKVHARKLTWLRSDPLKLGLSWVLTRALTGSLRGLDFFKMWQPPRGLKVLGWWSRAPRVYATLLWYGLWWPSLTSHVVSPILTP